MLVTRLIIIAAGILLYCTVASSQESGEYWGSHVRAYNSNKGAVFGVSWNYPSAREAIDRAVAACSENGGEDCLHRITAFSTVAPITGEVLDAYGYSEISVWRVRCVAVFDGEYNRYVGLYGNSPREAENKKHRDARTTSDTPLHKVYCNAK